MSFATRLYVASGNAHLLPIDRFDPTLALYLPLWYPAGDMTGSTIYSYDTSHVSFVNTGTAWNYQGRYFTGSDDFLKLTTANWRPTDSLGSISVWFNTTSTSQICLFSSSDQALTTKLFQFAKLDNATYSNRLAIDVAIPAGNNRTIRGSTSVGDGKWHFATIVSSGSAYSMFVDGGSETMAAIAGSNDGQWIGGVPDRDNVVVGSLIRTTQTGGWDNMIGEVIVHSRALTLADHTALMRATEWRYQ